MIIYTIKFCRLYVYRILVHISKKNMTYHLTYWRLPIYSNNRLYKCLRKFDDTSQDLTGICIVYKHFNILDHQKNAENETHIKNTSFKQCRREIHIIYSINKNKRTMRGFIMFYRKKYNMTWCIVTKTHRLIVLLHIMIRYDMIWDCMTWHDSIIIHIIWWHLLTILDPPGGGVWNETLSSVPGGRSPDASDRMQLVVICGDPLKPNMCKKYEQLGKPTSKK